MSKVKDRIRGTILFRAFSICKHTFLRLPKIISFCFYRLLPIQENKIVFTSFHGKSFSAQPRKIYDQLIADGGGNDFDLVCVLEEGIEHPGKIRIITPNSYRLLYELATAKIWIDNSRKDAFIKKRKGQFYIQTWHGPVCLKAVEKDAEDTLSPYYIKCAKNDSKNIDIFVAETSWRLNNIINAFWYNGQFIKASFRGINEADHNSMARHVYDNFSIPYETKIILYVPTFREDLSIDAYIRNYGRIIQCLKEKTKENWVFIVRLHSIVSEKANFITYDDTIFNGTNYHSLDELICAADIVISDYSGCMFDALRLNKKLILFCRDYDAYIQKERNLYFDLSDFPAPLVKSENELIEFLQYSDFSTYLEKNEALLNNIGYFPPLAESECVKIIKDNIVLGGKKN